MDLSVQFDDFDSTERFIVLEMDKYDVIMGMPWLEKHEPWIDWRGKAIGASRSALSDRALVSNVPTSVKSKGVRQDRQGASASEEFMGVAEVFGVPQEITVGSAREGAEAPPGSVDPDTGSRRAVWASTDKVLRAAHQVGYLVPPEQRIFQREHSVGNVVPRGARKVLIVWGARGTASNVVNLVPREPVKAKQEGKVGEGASCVDNIVLHKASMADDARDEASSDVGNRCRSRNSALDLNSFCGGSFPRRGRRRRRRHRKSGLRSQTGVAQGDSEPKAPQKRSSGGHYHIFNSEIGLRIKADAVQLEALPEFAELLNLEAMSLDDFLADLKAGEIAEMVLLRPEPTPEELNSSSVMDEHVLEDSGSSARRAWVLRSSRTLRIRCNDPLPREQCEVIDAFFAAKAKAGMVLESKSPHSSPTVCVRKPNGEWRLVHAYNKLNSATVPAQTPIPRKDVLLNSMTGCTLYSAPDLVDGYYQILMRESDIRLTAVSTPSGMLWEWLVMPQGLSNAPATINRLVTQLFRPLRAFAQTYFDDIFVHSRAKNGQTAMDVQMGHLRRVFDVMRANKFYANIDKCVFGAEEIKVLGCFVSSAGGRADPEKVKVITAWPTPRSQKDLQKWLGLANYLQKYSAGIKASLQRAPIQALPDESKPFSVACDTSDCAISCALPQTDEDGHEGVISFQARQLKAAERNYPVHDKELLAMKYALVKFRVYLLSSRPFVVYTDHASLRTATKSPHLSQRMARWLSFFAEYNFRVEYKPGKLNVLADALSRRHDFELAHISRVTTDLYDRTRLAYRDDEIFASLTRLYAAGEDAQVKWLSPRQKARLHCFEWANGLLHYRVGPGDPPRVVVTNDEGLKFDILQEAHDAPSGGHLGREKTFLSVSQTFCLDFVFGLLADDHGNTGILVVVYRLSKMVHLAPVLDTVTGEQAARLFVDCVFQHHGLPEMVVSDRDPRFTAAFWKTLFRLLGTKLSMSTADHPQTDSQTERVNRVLEETLRSVCAEAPRTWSDMLPMVEFALNNAVPMSARLTPFYLNGLRHPQMPLTLRRGTRPSGQSGAGARKELSSQVSDARPAPLRNQLSTFVDNRLITFSRVRGAAGSGDAAE
ncbi:unnamed protein product [Phytophthora fragariaefolia]|uniref:RNA-directed DNA polymerase n=1 Tax=Phytophthora fragariaefolia TaxID=1490495 RepID=A0A9W6TM16_9STRA|nr:unnamed protein product [Phytophthora fragariaefolia]